MPYSGINDDKLPDAVLDLPANLRRMWVTVFNSAYDEYDDEGRAAATAWAAVNDDQQGNKSLGAARCLYIGGGIKALGDDGLIGGYLVMFGDPDNRDLQGEFFTPDTDFKLDWFDKRPVLYQHGLDNTMKSTRIGEIVDLRMDNIGLWAEAQLDLRNAYVQKVWELAQRGTFGWSSGSLSHLVNVKGMQIKAWPLIEGSITPTPADPRTLVGIQPLKALIDLVEIAKESTTKVQNDDQTQDVEELPLKADDVEAAAIEPIEDSEDMTYEQALKIAQTLLSKLGQEMPEAELEAFVKSIMDGADDPSEPENMADAREQAAKMVGEITTAITSWMAKQEQEAAIERETERAAKSLLDSAKPVSKVPTGVTGNTDRKTTITVKSKWDSLSAEDMSFLMDVEKLVDGWSPDQQFLRELADKASKSYQAGKIGFSDENRDAAIKGINMWADMGGGRKADELDYSTLSSYGDEWVQTLWSDQLWNTARISNVVLPQMRVIEMPSTPFELPLESTDPTVYYVPETQDENQLNIDSSNNPMPDSKIGTSKVTLTASKLALRVGFSSELVEDSIVPVIPQFRAQAMRTMMDAIDSVILNGDDSTSGNINYDGATPPTTAAYKAFAYSLRHTAVIDNSGANAISGGGLAVTVRKLREARFALADQYAVRPDELVYITNASTMAKLLGMDEVLTRDKWGDMATIATGQFGMFDGSPFVVSAQLGLSASNGKVHSSTGNSYGSIVISHKPSFIVGYRRRVRTTVDYYAPLDAYQMVLTVRMALGRRDQTCASVLYYLDV